jgi:hypothetical protein
VICVAEFEYRLQNGIHVRWAVTVSGYDDFDDANRERVSHDTLVDVESTMDRFERQYADLTGASLVAVKGAHGWREFEWSSGAVHRYEWNHFEVDLRCPRCGNPDNDPYMVTDELWASSGLESYECFRCLENAIGRQLVPVDFKRGIARQRRSPSRSRTAPAHWWPGFGRERTERFCGSAEHG